jgi:GNAT superfamily N-acetyltransferase
VEGDMKIEMNIFQEKHKEIYFYNSSGYAPFAFWKMQRLCEDGEAFFIPEYECYYVVRNKHLLIYSSPDNQCHIPVEELNNLDCISMKADIFNTIKDKLSGFQVSYFECLYYDKNYTLNIPINNRFNVVKFDFLNQNHFKIAAEIINENEGDFLKADNIKKMTTFPTFDPSLWVFVQGNVSGELIGIGISTYHPEVMETDLDWIYISNTHHGQGAGRFMIEEIIRRSSDRSRVIRVGGTVEFYKKCGFYNKELWAWTAKPGYSFYAPSIQPNVL